MIIICGSNDNHVNNNHCDSCDDDPGVNYILKIFDFLFDKSHRNFMVKCSFILNLKYFNLNFLF